MTYFIDKFVLWWMLRQWDLDGGNMSDMQSERILAEIGLIDDVDKFFKLRLRRIIKRLALVAEERERDYYRGEVKNLQGLAASARDKAEKFRKLNPKKDASN